MMSVTELARSHAEIDHGIEFKEWGVLGWDWRVKPEPWTRQRPPYDDETVAIVDAVKCNAEDCHTCEMFTWDFEEASA